MVVVIQTLGASIRHLHITLEFHEFNINKTMKKFRTIATAVIGMFIMVTSCSKDKTENLTSPFRLSQIVLDNGNTTNYIYNSSNQIKKILESSGLSEDFYYYSKGRIDKVTKNTIYFTGYTEAYHYQGEILSYITFSINPVSGSIIPDSVCFVYDDLKCVSQVNDFYKGKLKGTTNYFYNAGKRIIKSIESNVDYISFDTVNYEWSNDGNLMKITEDFYNMYNNELKHYYHKKSYEYYDCINYFSTIHYPEFYLLYHNCFGMSTLDQSGSKKYIKKETTISSSGSGNRIYNVTANSDSLPIRVEINSIGWNLTYEKIK